MNGGGGCTEAAGLLFLQADPTLQRLDLHIFLSAVEKGLRAACPVGNPAARIGAVAFILRFGALLSRHVHLYCEVVDEVFETAAEAELLEPRQPYTDDAIGIHVIQSFEWR